MDRPVTETEVLVSSADVARLRRAFEAVTTAPVDELTRRREVRFAMQQARIGGPPSRDSDRERRA